MPLTQVQGGMILPSTTLTTPIVATTMGVGNATPSTSGAGITFPATQSASTDANTLDDYEEGTWTPTAGSDGGSSSGQSYATRNGKYTKIGNLVTCEFEIDLTTAGTIPVASYAITGLPFTSSSSFLNAGVGYFGYIANSSTGAYSFVLNVAANNTLAYTNGFTSAPSTSISNVKIWANGAAVRGVITYWV